MSATTELPTWAVYAISFGTPGTAFAGILLGQVLTRRNAKELEKRSRREQVMKTLQWAAEMSISQDQAKSRLGLSQLRALSASNLNDQDVQAFVDAALDAVVEDVVEEIEEAEETEEPVAVVRIASVTASTAGTLKGEPSLPSEDTDEGTGNHG
jgi:DNA gyrase/topoisomerase IV subunit B